MHACKREAKREAAHLLVGVVDVDPGWFFDTTPLLYNYEGPPNPENTTNVQYIHLGTRPMYIISEG